MGCVGSELSTYELNSETTAPQTTNMKLEKTHRLNGSALPQKKGDTNFDLENFILFTSFSETFMTLERHLQLNQTSSAQWELPSERPPPHLAIIPKPGRHFGESPCGTTSL